MAEDIEKSSPVLTLSSKVNAFGWNGTIKFIGNTQFADGEWIGLELTSTDGRNDGTVNGFRYFFARKNHGIFVRRSNVKLGYIQLQSQNSSPSLTNIKSSRNRTFSSATDDHTYAADLIFDEMINESRNGSMVADLDDFSKMMESVKPKGHSKHHHDAYKPLPTIYDDIVEPIALEKIEIQPKRSSSERLRRRSFSEIPSCKPNNDSSLNKRNANRPAAIRSTSTPTPRNSAKLRPSTSPLERLNKNTNTNRTANSNRFAAEKTQTPTKASTLHKRQFSINTESPLNSTRSLNVEAMRSRRNLSMSNGDLRSGISTSTKNKNSSKGSDSFTDELLGTKRKSPKAGTFKERKVLREKEKQPCIKAKSTFGLRKEEQLNVLQTPTSCSKLPKKESVSKISLKAVLDDKKYNEGDARSVRSISHASFMSTKRESKLVQPSSRANYSSPKKINSFKNDQIKSNSSIKTPSNTSFTKNTKSRLISPTRSIRNDRSMSLNTFMGSNLAKNNNNLGKHDNSIEIDILRKAQNIEKYKTEAKELKESFIRAKAHATDLEANLERLKTECSLEIERDKGLDVIMDENSTDQSLTEDSMSYIEKLKASIGELTYGNEQLNIQKDKLFDQIKMMQKELDIEKCREKVHFSDSGPQMANSQNNLKKVLRRLQEMRVEDKIHLGNKIRKLEAELKGKAGLEKEIHDLKESRNQTIVALRNEITKRECADLKLNLNEIRLKSMKTRGERLIQMMPPEFGKIDVIVLDSEMLLIEVIIVSNIVLDQLCKNYNSFSPENMLGGFDSLSLDYIAIEAKAAEVVIRVILYSRLCLQSLFEKESTEITETMIEEITKRNDHLNNFRDLLDECLSTIISKEDLSEPKFNCILDKMNKEVPKSEEMNCESDLIFADSSFFECYINVWKTFAGIFLQQNGQLTKSILELKETLDEFKSHLYGLCEHSDLQAQNCEVLVILNDLKAQTFGTLNREELTVKDVENLKLKFSLALQKVHVGVLSSEPLLTKSRDGLWALLKPKSEELVMPCLMKAVDLKNSFDSWEKFKLALEGLKGDDTKRSMKNDDAPMNDAPLYMIEEKKEQKLYDQETSSNVSSNSLVEGLNFLKHALTCAQSSSQSHKLDYTNEDCYDMSASPKFDIPNGSEVGQILTWLEQCISKAKVSSNNSPGQEMIDSEAKEKDNLPCQEFDITKVILSWWKVYDTMKANDE